MDESILKLGVGDLRVQVRIQPNLKTLEIQLLDMLPQMEFIGSTTYSVWLENQDPPAGKSLFFEIQCNPDLVTSYLVTNPDLVTILKKTIFLVHKNILFSDNLVFSDPSI